MTRFFIALALMASVITGCVPSPYYQKSFAIPSNNWTQDYKPSFVFEIEDSNIHYNTSFIVRHTNNYAYANIWLNVLVKKPGAKNFVKTRIEIPLASPQGKWLGVGMGEIYEQRRMIVLDHKVIPITDDLISISEESINDLYTQKGRYEIRLEQNMREQSLSDILHIGLRVEKSSRKKTTPPLLKQIS